jgi:glycosyltransferase involved in cell wall biosynthesis
MTLFSVLIANYNNGQYLKEAIDSVFNQTYKNWEIIILDDCSTDNSKEVYSLFDESPRIKVYFNEFNLGVGFTKRRLSELAEGELLAFLDPDDVLLPEAIEIMVKSHEENPKASMTYSRLIICDENLKNQKPSMYCIPIPFGDTALNHPPAKAASQFAVFKAANYNKTTGINPKYKLSEDMDLYYKLEDTGPIILVDKHLYLYRNHKGSISLFDNRFDALIWNIQVKIDTCRRRNIEEFEVLKKSIPNHFEIVERYENSIDYRFGNFILKPLRILLKIIGYYNGK